MSPEFEQIVGRAVLDEGFRRKLIADPQKTIEETNLNLDAEEKKKLKESIEQLKNEVTIDQLEERMGQAPLFW
ncbi:MAG: hypothetical protein GWN55_14835 [Phycisphaerae bacterium]|nr:hypothetical protein [Phycisphaerae bacterium]